MDVLLGGSAYIQYICLVVIVLHVSVALNRDLFLINFSVKRKINGRSDLSTLMFSLFERNDCFLFIQSPIYNL
jgi:hypothetical protein